jgi:NAD(P)-dependent dehydrogenase (short-subunit alcohol dehydrogenase family)
MRLRRVISYLLERLTVTFAIHRPCAPVRGAPHRTSHRALDTAAATAEHRDMQTAIVTGGNRGLGLATARELAAMGWRIVLACRDVAEGERARAGFPQPDHIEVAALDVANLDAVRGFAATRAGSTIDALICNAAIQLAGAVSHTDGGLERTFATNHLGHFLLARTLAVAAGRVGRIVFVASNTHDPGKLTGMPAPDLRDLDGFAHGRAFLDEPVATAGRRRYTTSKLCNVLCAYQLQHVLDAAGAATAVTAFDPGMMPGTDLARDYGPVARFAWHYVLPALTVAPVNINAVATSARRLAKLAAAADPAYARGAYVSCGRIAASSAASRDRDLALALWNLSSDLCSVAHELDAPAARSHG